MYSGERCVDYVKADPLTQQLQQDPGRATTVKITVIGRPGTAVEQGQAVAVALVSEKVPYL